MENILVSIICLTYNHEKYIRKTLKGFVSQKTNFNYEIIVHDDASTDQTTAIVREFAERYPLLFKPILQNKNQYSQGVDITRTFILPLVEGRYIALCEGDDFWTSTNKLQTQIDFLESNPGYSACTHKTYIKEIISGLDYSIPRIMQDRDFSKEEIIIKGGAIFATCSFVARSEVFFELPSCYQAKGFGDYPLFIFAAMKGRLRCLSQNMAQYNHGTDNSWSVRVRNNKELMSAHYREEIRLLKEIDKYHNYNFSSTIQKKIDECEYNILCNENEKDKIYDPRFKEFCKRKRIINIRTFILKLLASTSLGRIIWKYTAELFGWI